MKMKTFALAFGLAALAAGIAAPAQAAMELTFGMQDQQGNNVYKGVEAMKKKLEALSNGSMSLKLFPSSQLGDFKAMTSQVEAGELDFTINGYPDLSYIIPELKLVGEPYVVRNYDQLLKIIKGPYGRKMEKKFEDHGVRVLDVWYFGTRQTTADRPIKSIDDMKGLKLRTPNVDFLVDYAKAVGAIPSPVAFQEVYLALQTHQVDAEENPLPTIKAMKFFEVQKSIAMTNHFIASKAVTISEKTWKKLTDKQRKWVVEAAKAGRDVNNKLMRKDEADLKAYFKKEGLSITHPDLKPFHEAMKPYYKKLDARFGDGAIEALINTK